MKIIYCINWNKYRNFKSPKISWIFNETLILSIICDKCGRNNDTIFKGKEYIEILKTTGWKYKWLKYIVSRTSNEYLII